jgi:F0F1-type ATP synthase delta subunit
MTYSSSDFLSQIKTKEDKLSLLSMIDNINAILYTKSFKTELKKKAPKEFYEILNKDFTKLKWQLRSIGEYLNELKEEIVSVETVEITLAFNPSQDFLDKLSNRVKTDFGKNVAPDVIVDQGIIAGAKIAFMGKIKDLSFRKMLKNTMNSEKERITACLA